MLNGVRLEVVYDGSQYRPRVALRTGASSGAEGFQKRSTGVTENGFEMWDIDRWLLVIGR